MKVIVSNRQKVLSLDTKSVQAVTKSALQLANKKYDEVNIHFIEESEICDLHDEFFDDPSPTDCISFPMDEDSDVGYLVLGDIFISPKAAVEYTKEIDADPYEELTLYLIHGLLHLLGKDDQTEAQRQEMRTLEKIYMDHLHAQKLLLQPKSPPSKGS
jgi:probable rRNA maturation factor